jgi:hypothetical protein
MAVAHSVVLVNSLVVLEELRLRNSDHIVLLATYRRKMTYAQPSSWRRSSLIPK